MFEIVYRFSAKNQNLCLDDLQQDNEKPYNLGIYSCHKPNVTRSQFFSITQSGVLRNELSCASIQQRFVFSTNQMVLTLIHFILSNILVTHRRAML